MWRPLIASAALLDAVVATAMPVDGVSAAASTLIVDDDGNQCKKAPFTQIQAAVDAAE